MFQLVKRYGEGADGLERRIAKLVEGTVRVAIDGGELAPAAFAVDAAMGAVTLDTAPDAGAAVTAGFEFDTPVRFDADRIEVTLESFDAGRMAAMPLIEVRI
jgi:uncharacterized protein (TIGR02217 family)